LTVRCALESRFAFAFAAFSLVSSLGCGASTPGVGSDAGNSASGADAGSPVPDASASDAPTTAFVLSSGAFTDQGTLPARFTCDGAGVSPPLAWTGAPAGTTEYALLMTTVAPDGLKWNWVLYAIPGAEAAIAEGATGLGTAGLTSDGPALAYSPPCSQGPGPKSYTFTLYALSGSPPLPSPANKVTGAVLTSAIGPLTLASSAVTVSYTR
jgi:phosphatidylethanolamine-binding protein (PEBP) family uncharacterized protein